MSGTPYRVVYVIEVKIEGTREWVPSALHERAYSDEQEAVQIAEHWNRRSLHSYRVAKYRRMG